MNNKAPQGVPHIDMGNCPSARHPLARDYSCAACQELMHLAATEESNVSKPSLVERIDAALSSIKRASFFGLDVEDAWAVTVLLRDCRATLDESGVLEPGTIVMYHAALLRGLEAAKGCIEIGFPEMAISNINGILDQIKPATATEEQTND